MALRLSLFALFASISLSAAQQKPTWDPNNLPDTTEQGQTGTNECGTGSSQDSLCQTAYVNSLDDFCLWAPPTGPQEIGASEQNEVAWCTAPGRGTRVIPPGAIQGAHFLQTPNYIQITGQIDGTMVNIARGDAGGELDPHGATGNGNPIGSLVFTEAFGNGTQQVKEWMNFMSDGEFCIRICDPADPNAWLQCQHIYDTMGCAWVMPGDYDTGSFDSCQGDTIAPPGVYGQSTFHQGDPQTPAAHAAGSSSDCQTAQTITPALIAASVTISASASASSASVSASSSSAVSSASASVSASAASSSATVASASSRLSASFSSRPTSTSSALPSATPSASASGGEALRVSVALLASILAAVICLA